MISPLRLFVGKTQNTLHVQVLSFPGKDLLNYYFER